MLDLLFTHQDGVDPEPGERPGLKVLAYDGIAGTREFQRLRRAPVLPAEDAPRRSPPRRSASGGVAGGVPGPAAARGSRRLHRLALPDRAEPGLLAPPGEDAARALPGGGRGAGDRPRGGPR